jgi:thiosulfate reductase cytochrome b subunit
MAVNAVPARTATSEPATPMVQVVAKHHALVRLSHWLNVPLLLLLAASGFSIYWAAPVFHHPPTHVAPRGDYFQDLGAWIARTLDDRGGPPANWFYDHFSLGTAQLALALRLHWLIAYGFMLNGLLYAIGLAAGRGWRALLPRGSDVREALAMLRFYAGVVPMALRRKPWPHPHIAGKYNALQRSAYFAMPLLGLLMVASGWVMHKPATLPWLERLLVSYDVARVLHLAGTLVLVGFLLPHVVLVVADGWDTLRSMITGWSRRVKKPAHD